MASLRIPKPLQLQSISALVAQQAGVSKKQVLWRLLIQQVTQVNQGIIELKLAEIRKLSQRHADACRNLTDCLLSPGASPQSIERIPQILQQNEVPKSAWFSAIQETFDLAAQEPDLDWTSSLAAVVFKECPDLAWFKTGFVEKVAKSLETRGRESLLQEVLQALEGKLQEDATYRNTIEVADIQQRIGESHRRSGHSDLAFDWIYKALMTRKNYGKKPAADSACALGEIALEKNQPEVALRYYLYALNIFQALGDNLRLSECYSSIEEIYEGMGDYYEAEKYRDCAVRSLRITSRPK